MGFGRTWGNIIGLVALLIFPGAAMAGNAIEGAKAAAMGGAFAAGWLTTLQPLLIIRPGSPS